MEQSFFNIGQKIPFFSVKEYLNDQTPIPEDIISPRILTKRGLLYQYSLLGRQMEHVINLLNSPVIGKKSSFSFVLLLTGLGISIWWPS